MNPRPLSRSSPSTAVPNGIRIYVTPVTLEAFGITVMLSLSVDSLVCYRRQITPVWCRRDEAHVHAGESPALSLLLIAKI